MNRRNFMTCSAIVGASLSTTTALCGENVSSPFVRKGAAPEAPFGDAISEKIKNYARVAPFAATAGVFHAGGLEEMKRHGFQLVIDLRQPHENGVREEAEEAARLEIAHRNLPLSANRDALNEIRIVAELIADRSNYPVMIHCVSGNRAGAAWALYRAHNGVPTAIAIEEGRAAGMRSRETLVRELLT